MQPIVNLTADVGNECVDINLHIDPQLSYAAQNTYLEIIKQVITRTQKEIKRKEKAESAHLEKKGLIKEKDRWEKIAKSLQKKQGATFRKGSAKSAEEKVKAAYAYFSEKGVTPTRDQVAEKAKVSVPTVRKYGN